MSTDSLQSYQLLIRNSKSIKKFQVLRCIYSVLVLQPLLLLSSSTSLCILVLFKLSVLRHQFPPPIPNMSFKTLDAITSTSSSNSFSSAKDFAANFYPSSVFNLGRLVWFQVWNTDCIGILIHLSARHSSSALIQLVLD